MWFLLISPILFCLSYFVPLYIRRERVRGRDLLVGVWGLAFLFGQVLFFALAIRATGGLFAMNTGEHVSLITIGTPGLITALLVGRALYSFRSAATVVFGTVVAAVASMSLYFSDRPILLPMLWNAFVVAAVFAMPNGSRNRLWSVDPNKCPKCGYDLNGISESLCPECGQTVVRLDWEAARRGSGMSNKSEA